jgi:hypothetical protein
MRRVSIIVLAALCVLVSLMANGVLAMTIGSDAPGNIFAAGKPVRFSSNDAQGELSYEVVDYFGATVASGAAAAGPGGASIALSELSPGWYELRCRDSAGAAVVSFGVVIDRGDKALSREGRVCADAASAWLLSDALRPPFAHMVRLAGIPWVRERLSWSNTQPGPGRFAWGRYQATADLLATEGVNICQIWHDSPRWTHFLNQTTRCPDDLRTVYRFTKTAAQQFARQIQAWEVWNEPDIAFWPDLSDRFAGLQKAAYWGLKDGHPAAIVLQGSLCRGVSNFQRNLYDSGALDYFDIFNWHIYNEPVVYPRALSAYRRVLREYEAAGRPAWMTEAGIRLTVPGGPDNRILSPDNQRAQCRFITRSAVMSLAAGNDRNFFFVLPDYMEGEVQFGALHPDLTPYPSFVALSAAANLIGVSTFLGEYTPISGAAACYVFSTSEGGLLVAWADEKTSIEVPIEKPVAVVADIFGNRREVPVTNGTLRLDVGPEAAYVFGIGDEVTSNLRAPVAPRIQPPEKHPSRLVLVGYCDLPTNKRDDCYVLTSDQLAGDFKFTVDVYNFSDREDASGVVDVGVPTGWRVDQPQREIHVAAMGRESLAFRVMPSAPAEFGMQRIVVQGSFRDPNVAPSVSAFGIE